MNTDPVRSRNWLLFLDAAIAVLLFAFVTYAARQHLSSLNNGRSTVSSIEMLYGPAVMLAAGRGFYQPALDASPALGEFLRNERDSLSPEDLPPDLPEEPNSVSSYHRHLLYTVAFFWRLYGISWTSLEPLCAMLLALCGVAVYGIMRLGMGRLLAVALTVFFVLSPQMFTMLPSLRDFSKAPFLLMLIFLLGTLIKYRFRLGVLLALAAGLGLLNGIAMGFRQDALVFVAPGLVILAAAVIREGRPFQWRRVLVPVVFLVAFWAAGHPMLGRMEGGAQPYHPMVQGFSMKRAASLGLEPGAYEPLASGGDNYAFSMLNEYYRRVNNEPETCFAFNSRGSEIAGRQFLLDMALNFPGDLLARGYAALLRTLRYTDGIPVWDTANSWWKDRFEGDHAVLKHHMQRFGPVYALFAMLLISGASLPLALGLLFFALYVCGYVSLQCEFRHAFHLSFVPLWIVGFLVHCAWSAVLQLRGGIPAAWKACYIPLKRMVIFSAVSAAMILAPLYGLRVWQQYRVTPLLNDVKEAHRSVVPMKEHRESGWVRFSLEEPLAPTPKELLRPGMNDLQALYALAGVLALSVREEDTAPIWDAKARYFVLELAANPPIPWLTLLYESKIPWNNFSQLVRVHGAAQARDSLLYCFPAYSLKMSYGDITARNRFSGFALPEEQATAFRGLYEVHDFSSLHFLMHTVLPDGNVSEARKYQRILLEPDPLDAFRVDDEPVGVTVLAEMAARFGRTEEALLFYKAALMLNADIVQRQYIAQGLMQLGDLDTACRVVLEGAALADADTRFSADLGGQIVRRYAAAGQQEKAGAALRALAEAWTVQHPDLLLQMASEVPASEYVDLLLECYAGILRAHPEQEAAANRAEALIRDHADTQRLLTFWREIAAANPESVLPFLRVGLALETTGDAAAAAEAYTAAFTRDPARPEAVLRYNLSVVMGTDPNLALRRVREVLATSPDLAPLAAERAEQAAEHLAGDGKAAAAAEAYALAFELRPTAPVLCLRQAELLLQAGEVLAARAALEKILNTNQAEEAANLLEATLAEVPSTEERLSAWQEILDRHPANAFIARQYARTLFLLGHFEEMERFLTDWIEKAPAQPESTMLRALSRFASEKLTPEQLASDTVFTDVPGLRTQAAALLQQAATGKAPEWTKRALHAATLLAPESGDTWMQMGTVLENEGKWEDALQTYRDAFPGTALPDQALLAGRMDSLYTRLNQPRERLDWWQSVLQQYPDNPVVLLHAGLACEANGRWKEAADAYGTLSGKAGYETVGQLRSGAMLVRLGDKAKGVSDIQAAVGADQTLRSLAGMLCLQAGTDLLQGDDAQSAGELLDLAVEFNPDDAFAYVHQGDARKKQGLEDGAEQSWRRALELAPDTAAGAEAAHRLDGQLAAEKRLDLWRALAVQHPEARLPKARLALALADAGNLEEAAALCQSIAPTAEDREGRLACACVACLSGEVDRGLAALDALAAEAPQSKGELARQLADRGMNRLEAGEAEKAEPFIRKAAEYVPENLLYTVQLGRVLLARQKFEEAAAQFRKVLLAMPESPNSANWLDEAWAGLKNPEGQRLDWQSIVDAHPDAVIPRERLDAIR